MSEIQMQVGERPDDADPGIQIGGDMPPVKHARTDSPALRAVCGEYWAITSDWLHVIAALALRRREDAASMANRIRAGAYEDDDDDRKPPTPEERFVKAFFVGAAAGRVKKLEGQATGRAVVMDNVAVLPLLGPIFPRANMMTAMSGATSVAEARQDLHAAMMDDSVDAIVMAVDSPGGSVNGIANFADHVYSLRNQKPMMAHVSGTGASAAYWIASSFERISVDRTAMVGSIGVIGAVPKQITPDSNGEMLIEIVSSNAPDKRPDPTTGDGLLTIRAGLDAIEASFLADVARGRGVTVDSVKSDFGRGGVLLGHSAVKAGMVDGVETLEAAIARMGRVGKSRRKQSGR